MIIHNSTQNFNIEINEDGDTKCDNNNCTMTIAAMPRRDFCSATGSNSEFAYVKIKITGLSEEVLIKYHVPCECNCSRKVEQNSKFCGYNGDYSCGVCSCYAGWYVLFKYVCLFQIHLAIIFLYLLFMYIAMYIYKLT